MAHGFFVFPYMAEHTCGVLIYSSMEKIKNFLYWQDQAEVNKLVQSVTMFLILLKLKKIYNVAF